MEEGHSCDDRETNEAAELLKLGESGVSAELWAELGVCADESMDGDSCIAGA